ncbi:YagK/YfjJ domain-containing protein [Pseudomonas aeruginosa]|uniref:YagK/YfjJ domain-containing protein n=1 Tax=Pseudomonas aeruginosa TaxID=287 RepID=UPI000FFF5414|nr:inovirus-type Gp2 protein [Pseudomonas aeruginosa]
MSYKPAVSGPQCTRWITGLRPGPGRCSRQSSPRYHALILLNRDAFYTVGRLQSETPNTISRLQEDWASTLGLQINQVGANYQTTRCTRWSEHL